ncbi:MAG: hypothetical protein D6768_03275 [Chloroflexi bacterium]|nr:MAG: hypothetical protein D6768_03275 [Chloroflexota bacterium]
MPHQPGKSGKNELINSLPPEWPTGLLPQIQRQVRAGGRKLVVLDDDPTGTQTVHGIPVLTHWPVEALAAELAGDSPAFYLLTNSRSLPLPKAQALNAEIGRNLTEAARQTGTEFAVVSRSDSTLRGHFPGEVEALAHSLPTRFDGWIINPFFLEGGRYTINDIHYVAEGDVLTPAGETEFAKDAAFGYRASNLRRWVEEKTGGKISAGAVVSITIDDVRRGGPARVAKKLLGVEKDSVVVVNAAGYRDLEVFVLGLLAAEAEGRRFLYRTAASFVRVRAGISPRPLLTTQELAPAASGGGLVVVGSYVPRTGTQINALFEQTDIQRVELNVKALLDSGRQAEEIERAAEQVESNLQAGQNVVLYTSRQLITGTDAAASLAIGRRVSASLVAVVRGIATRPRFLLAKGGITSSDVATQGLNIKKALVMGQILPGVPVWQAGPESRYPGMAYIVFPGNVGGPNALVEAVSMFG